MGAIVAELSCLPFLFLRACDLICFPCLAAPQLKRTVEVELARRSREGPARRAQSLDAGRWVHGSSVQGLRLRAVGCRNFRFGQGVVLPQSVFGFVAQQSMSSPESTVHGTLAEARPRRGRVRKDPEGYRIETDPSLN